MSDLFLIITVGGLSAMVPFEGTREACDAAAVREQARLETAVKCEHRGPEHMVWRLHPELKAIRK